jgi:hypothetical protein
MQKEPFHIDPQKIELEETSSTRIHKNMKVEETLLYGPTKKETRINHFYEQQKIAESILYGPIKNEVEEPIYKGPQQK